MKVISPWWSSLRVVPGSNPGRPTCNTKKPLSVSNRIMTHPLVTQLRFARSELVRCPILFCGLALTILMSYRERQAMDLSGLKWGVVGRFLGTIVAAAVLTNVAKKEMTLAFGVLVLFAVALSALGLHVNPTIWTLLSAGALSGFMGTTSNTGGPPIALCYQNAPGARLRTTISGFFVPRSCRSSP